LKIKDFIKPFCTKGILESTICITLNEEEFIFNAGDSLTDLQSVSDLSARTVKSAYVCESVLFINVCDRPKKFNL
jgi:hypothetical protein